MPNLIIVHGGAGDRKPRKEALRKLTESILLGYGILNNGGKALDAVVRSITILEDSGLFNAGSGGYLQFDGVRRLDAALMDGKDLKAGSVIGVEGVMNPIELARIMMDLPHITMTNVGAKRIAEAHNLETLSEPDSESLKILKRNMKKEKRMLSAYREYFSTVGAVALDSYGNLAVGSSTGGVPAMLPGRVGDTPIIGAGIYAENEYGAVSCTGKGEYNIRLALAKEICMNLGRKSPTIAAQLSLRRLSKIGGKAGVIVLNRKGQFTIRHMMKYMPSGYMSKKGIVVNEGFKEVIERRI